MGIQIDIIAWLHSLPPEIIYGVVLSVVGVESLGVPLPGEIVLMSAALLSSQGVINPALIWLMGATGAIVGDSIGYMIGRRHGHRLITKLEKWFPRHINPRTAALAERLFHRHGTKMVFFGRFIALLRIFAGPLAGVLKLPYGRFLLANAAGGIVWSGLAVWLVYFLGVVAEHWFKRLSWIALGVAIIVGIIVSFFIRRRINSLLEKID